MKNSNEKALVYKTHPSGLQMKHYSFFLIHLIVADYRLGPIGCQHNERRHKDKANQNNVLESPLWACSKNPIYVLDPILRGSGKGLTAS